MIPKTIHYCWFGGNEKPDIIKKCIASWKKYCPDYEIIEWNESNFDVDCIQYVREAYAAKKWAFVSDYARLKIIYDNGGIYLDTDVLLQNDNINELLKYDCWLACDDVRYVSTGLGFGAEKHNELIFKMADAYNYYTYPSGVSPARDTEIVSKAIPEWKRSYNSVVIGNTLIIGIYDYGKYAKHLYTATWTFDLNDEMIKHFDRLENVANGSDKRSIRKARLKWKITSAVRHPKIIDYLYAPPEKGSQSNVYTHSSLMIC